VKAFHTKETKMSVGSTKSAKALRKNDKANDKKGPKSETADPKAAKHPTPVSKLKNKKKKK